MQTTSPSTGILLSLALILGLRSVALAGELIEVSGLVRRLIADPSRNMFYAALATDEIIAIDATTGTVTLSTPFDSLLGPIVLAEDGGSLFVYLADSDTVAELKLPDQSFVRQYRASGTPADATSVETMAGRLLINRREGLSILDTATGAEVYFGDPHPVPGHWTYAGFLRVGPDGRTLYAQDTGLSPSSIPVFDISGGAPRFVGEECCHGCLGSSGRGMEFPPNDKLLYVFSGGRIHVLSSVPLLPAKFVGLSGGVAFAMSLDGGQIYLSAFDELVVIRACDWLPYHARKLQGDGAHHGLALARDQRTLAVALQPLAGKNYIELIDVASLTPNRGGIRLRPLDNLERAPIFTARIQHPIRQGDTGFFDWEGAALGRAPMEAGTFETIITAPNHETLTLDVTVTPGAWTDLGDIVMTRLNGDMPRPRRICAAPAARIGRRTKIEVSGIGFLEGKDLLLTSFNPDFVVEDFEFENWVTLRATVAVSPEALPGRTNGLDLINGDGQSSVFGSRIMLMLPQALFGDGFESGDTSAWSSTVP